MGGLEGLDELEDNTPLDELGNDINEAIYGSVPEYKLLGSTMLLVNYQTKQPKQSNTYTYEVSYSSFLPENKDIWVDTLDKLFRSSILGKRLPDNLKNEIISYLPLRRTPTLLNSLPDTLIENILSYIPLHKIDFLCGSTLLRCQNRLLNNITRKFYDFDEIIMHIKKNIGDSKFTINWYEVLEFLENKFLKNEVLENISLDYNLDKDLLPEDIEKYRNLYFSKKKISKREWNHLNALIKNNYISELMKYAIRIL